MKYLKQAVGVPLGVIAIFGTVIAYGVATLPNGFDNSGGLAQALSTLLFIYTCGLIFRARNPESRLGAYIASIAQLLLLALTGALATSILAIGSHPFVDHTLHAADRLIFPFYDWPAVVYYLAERPYLHRGLSIIYESLNWQPLLLATLLTIYRGNCSLDRFVSAWALGLLMCIAPFHWLPALSAYNFYDISLSEMPIGAVDLGWRFLPVLEGMRDGTIDSISTKNLTGMVTIPSFHACGATILVFFWKEINHFRWVMIATNIAMIFATVPIGSHYIVDVIAGIIVGMIAVLIGRYIDNRVHRYRLKPDISDANMA